MARYLILGNMTIDDTVMPDGRTAMGTVGGNVLYAAVGARTWTDDLAMVSRLGRGYPPDLLRDMETEGYRTEGLVPVELNCIRQWQLYDREGGRNYVRLPSAPSYADLSPRPEEIPAPVAAGAIACHIAPMPLPLQVPLVHWARLRGLRVTLDPHHEWVSGCEAEWRRILPAVDAFLPSQAEAEKLLGGWPGPEAAARQLAGWGARIVCLKLGPDGAVVYNAHDGSYAQVPTVVLNPVDTTGCGDAFCGGFLVGWQETGSPETALRFATVSASFVAADFGARHAFRANREEARRRLESLAERRSRDAS